MYDDYGAGTSDPSAAQFQRLEPTDGRDRYPTDEERFAGNAADLFQLRVAVDGDRVVLLAWLDASSTARHHGGVGGLRRRRSRGGQAARPLVPDASGLRASGADVVVTAWGTGADLVDLRTGRRTRLAEVAADVTANAIEGGGADGAPGRGAVEGLGRDGAVRDRGAAGFMAVPSGAPTPSRPGNGRQRRRGPGLQRGVPRPRQSVRLRRGAAGRRARDR